jgi:hypothetical protein
MKLANSFKTLALVGATSLTQIAGTSQADPGNNQAYKNGWMSGPPPGQMRPGPFKQELLRFDQRLDTQLQRILNGMETGKLTMREAVGLLREHVAINNLERQYLGDGRLGPNELRDLNYRLDQASRHIVFENRDGERAGFPGRAPNDGRLYR